MNAHHIQKRIKKTHTHTQSIVSSQQKVLMKSLKHGNYYTHTNQNHKFSFFYDAVGICNEWNYEMQKKKKNNCEIVSRRTLESVDFLFILQIYQNAKYLAYSKHTENNEHLLVMATEKQANLNDDFSKGHQ